MPRLFSPILVRSLLEYILEFTRTTVSMSGNELNGSANMKVSFRFCCNCVGDKICAALENKVSSGDCLCRKSLAAYMEGIDSGKTTPFE